MGLAADKFPSEDKLALHLVNVVKTRMGSQAMTAMHLHFEDYEDTRVLMVRCPRSSAPVFVKDGEVERFYVRTGPATTEMPASQTQANIKQRFAN